MKKVLVFGGSGFIGSHYIDSLKMTNCKIINVDKISYCSNLDYCKSSKNYKFLKLNLLNLNKVNNLISELKPHCIINFAAESHVDRSIDNPNSFVQNNILGTSNLLISILNNFKKLVKNYKKFKFIQVSTDEVYGSYDQGYANEKANFSPNSPYAASKASSDLLCRSFFKTYNLPIIVCNSSNNYGTRQYFEKFIPRSIISIRLGQNIEVYGKGNQLRQWINVSDNVHAIEKVLKYGAIGETYNIGGDDVIKNIDLIKKILKLVKNNFSHLVNGIPNIVFVNDRPGHDFRYALNSNKLKKQTNWMPKIDLDVGLNKTINYYLNVELNNKIMNSIKRRGKID